MAIGVAVGSQKLKIVFPDAEMETETVGHNQAGIEQIMTAFAQDGRNHLVISGNRRWSEALAYSLQARGVTPRYLGREGGKGEKGGNDRFLKKALSKGVIGRNFFREPHPVDVAKEAESNHPWVMLANEHERLNDEIRRFKHRALDALRLIFPELLTLGSKCWGVKYRRLFQECRWDELAQYGLDYRESLGQAVPVVKRRAAEEDLKTALFDLKMIEEKRERTKEAVAELVDSHPVVQAYNESFSAMMVILLIGWRSWGVNKKGWLRLRSYAGLSVSRLDSNGKPRISRKRPPIRTNIYHLFGSGRGKKIIEKALNARRERKREEGLGESELSEVKLRRVKRIEAILRDIWGILKSELLKVNNEAMVGTT